MEGGGRGHSHIRHARGVPLDLFLGQKSADECLFLLENLRLCNIFNTKIYGWAFASMIPSGNGWISCPKK